MSSVRDEIIALTQESDRLTDYYVKRIKQYGAEATQTEVAQGEARIAEIGKMVANLEAKEDANYGFKGQGWKERMETFKSTDARMDDAMARIQEENRPIDEAFARMKKEEGETNAEVKETRGRADRAESLARDTKTAMGIRKPTRVPPVPKEPLRRPLSSDLDLRWQPVDIMRSNPESKAYDKLGK